MSWDDLPHNERADLFGGAGAVRIWNLLGAGHAPPFSAVLRCELAPGGSVGPHRQQRDPELIVCLDGDGTITVDGQSAPFSAGRLAYLPLGGVLSLQNRSEAAPLRYLIVKANPPQD